MKLQEVQRKSLVSFFVAMIDEMLFLSGNDQRSVKRALMVLKERDSATRYDELSEDDPVYELINLEICSVFHHSGQGITTAYISDAQAPNAKSYLKKLCELAQTVRDLNQLGSIRTKADLALPELVAERLTTVPAIAPVVPAAAGVAAHAAAARAPVSGPAAFFRGVAEFFKVPRSSAVASSTSAAMPPELRR